MKNFITLLFCLFCMSSIAQDIPLPFSAIPVTSNDLNRPGGGAEQWNDQNAIILNKVGSLTQSLDAYYRFSYTDIQPYLNSRDLYDSAFFDSKIQDAIDRGQKFSFAIMPICSFCTGHGNQQSGLPDPEGAYLFYPFWLHNAMQAENPTDWNINGSWWPNWNSPSWISGWKAMNVFLNHHIMNGSYHGVRYRDVINFIDASGYGPTGEWTNIIFHGGGTDATVATLDSLYAATAGVYSNFRVVTQIAVFDGRQLTVNTNIPPDVGWFALQFENKAGHTGIRRENFGATDNYVANWTLANRSTFTVPQGFPGAGSVFHFDTAIQNRYKYAPWTGEPCCVTNSFNNLPEQMKEFHVSSFGNGNLFGGEGDPATIDNNFRAASKAAGYRIFPDTGSISTARLPQGEFSINLAWRNTGASATYEHWKVIFQIVKGSEVKWTDTSSFDPYLFIHAGLDSIVTDHFNLGNIDPGSGYELKMFVKDPNGYRFPMPLFISRPQNKDGSYTLLSGIDLNGIKSKTAANAGPDHTITLPVSSVTLGGEGSKKAVANLIVIFGESNAAGMAQNSSCSPAELAPRKKVYIINNQTLQFETLQLGVNNNIELNEGSMPVHGLENGLANAVEADTSAQPVYVVKAGSSGARIIEWLINGSPINSQDGWGPLTTRMDAAISYLQSHQIPFKITVWQSIGINDYNAGTSNEEFAVEMNQFRNDLRNRYGKDIPFLTTAFFDEHPYNPVLTAIAGQDPLHISEIIPTEDATREDAAHWDYNGLKLIAGRMVNKMVSTPGTITGFSWTQISGPNSALLTTPLYYTTKASGLIQGRYAFKLNLNNGTSDTVQINVLAAAPHGISIFSDQVPAATTNNDLANGATTIQGLETGIRFKSKVPGYVTGIRYYRTAGNTGVHIGELYSSSGERLAQKNFTNETVTGWQYTEFPAPVAIDSNTDYMAACFSSDSYYVEDNDYFLKQSVTNDCLIAAEDGTNGASGTDPGTGQGTYKYTTAPAFPDQLYRSANYWVDIIFLPTATKGTDQKKLPDSLAINKTVDSSKISPLVESLYKGKPDYFLSQNYPNPAHGDTKIDYAVPVQCRIEITLFNIMGSETKMMVSEIKSPGKYTYNLNTSVLPKGTYFISMHAGTFHAVKKMVIE